ncbi:MAG: replicative DNA helicase [Calditrichaeota bacterium]|nr:replicative DNA helicase [Calditrichota bacterium]
MAEKKQSKTSSTGSKKRQETARIPPHNSDMERAVLCCALIDKTGFARIVSLVKENSFYERRHTLIFAAMARLFNSSSPIDVLSVSEELDRSKNLEAAGGAPYLVSLSNEITASTHAEHYAKTVQEHSALRGLISAASRLSNEAYETGDPPGDLIDRAMQELFEIGIGSDDKGFQHIEPVMHDLHDHLDKLYHSSDGALTGISTGFHELDEKTSGFQNGDLVVVAARPSMGKTALALDMALNAAKIDKKPVAFFSLEMASMAIAMRLIAADAQVDLHKLRSGRLRDRDWTKLALSTGELSQIPFYIDDTGVLGVTELRARARMLKQKADIGIVFVDYMQLMRPPQAGSREQEVAKISRALKGLARELNVPVVALSQLSRAVETRGEDARPQLSDLRDSGAIEQDADLVIFIHRWVDYSNLSDEDARKKVDDGEKENEVEDKRTTAEIIIRKQRNGPTGTIKLGFEKTHASFRNLTAARDAKLASEQAPIDESSLEDKEDVPF